MKRVKPKLHMHVIHPVYDWECASVLKCECAYLHNGVQIVSCGVMCANTTPIRFVWGGTQPHTQATWEEGKWPGYEARWN